MPGDRRGGLLAVAGRFRHPCLPLCCAPMRRAATARSACPHRPRFSVALAFPSGEGGTRSVTDEVPRARPQDRGRQVWRPYGELCTEAQGRNRAKRLPSSPAVLIPLKRTPRRPYGCVDSYSWTELNSYAQNSKLEARSSKLKSRHKQNPPTSAVGGYFFALAIQFYGKHPEGRVSSVPTFPVNNLFFFIMWISFTWKFVPMDIVNLYGIGKRRP